ncbi:MAG: glycoside hydrolase family 15 protein [Spirochaetia bacterium]
MDLVKRSIELIEAEQTETGAFPACSKFENYRFNWLRDSAFIIYALCRWERYEPAKKAMEWNIQTITAQKDKITALESKIRSSLTPGLTDFLPARYHLDGKTVSDNWPAFQIDGYGAWLWAAAEYVNMSGDREFLEELRPAVDETVRYLDIVWMLPNYDCWEENGDGIHPSSLACVYGGCRSMAELTGRVDLALIAGKVKLFLERALENRKTVPKYLGSNLSDASSLWLSVPFGCISPEETLMQNTASYIEKNILKNGGVKRYPGDTYYGGGSWIILSAWLGWYYVKTGEPEKSLEIFRWIETQANDKGELPEQVSEYLFSEEEADNWQKRWGSSASPLLWSHAMYLILAAELSGERETRTGIYIKQGGEQ